jgi:hypothetical protein
MFVIFKHFLTFFILLFDNTCRARMILSISNRVRLAPLERLGGTCPPISCGKRGGLIQAMVAPGGSGTGSSRGGSYRSPASRWGANPEQPWPDFGPPRLLPEIAQNRGSTSDIMENLLSTPPVGARIEE